MIVIAPRSYHLGIINYYRKDNPFFDIKVVDKNDLIEATGYFYSSDIITHILKNYDYSYDEIINSNIVMGWSAEYLPYSLFNSNYTINYSGSIINGHEYLGYYVGDAYVTILENKMPNLKIKVSNIKEKTQVTLPRTYYLGYTLTDENNKRYKLVESGFGLLETNIDSDGIYTLKYTGTIFDKISKFCRLISIVVILVGGFRIWKRRK